MDEELEPLKRAAERFGVTYDRLRRAAYDGRLDVVRKGYERMVRPSEVERFLREGGRRARTSTPSVPRREGVGMGKILAIAITKGGVGKSTTALSLGAALAEQGQRVLLIDCDHQCSLTLAAGVDVQNTKYSLHTAIMDYLSTYELRLDQAIMSTPVGLDLIPSSVRLTRADKELNFATQREYVLQKLLAPIVPRYDVLLIDTEPATNNLVTNALVAAHQVLIPLEPEPLAVESLAVTLEDIAQIRRSGLNPDLSVSGVLLTKVDGRRRMHQEAVRYTREEFGDRVPIFKTMIKDTVRFPESQALRQTILQYDPRGDGAEAYRAVAQEVVHGWG
jgi:chromosome partitioning protein